MPNSTQLLALAHLVLNVLLNHPQSLSGLVLDLEEVQTAVEKLLDDAKAAIEQERLAKQSPQS